MKVIPICGSLKIQKEMMIVAEKFALEGNCVLTSVYQISENSKKQMNNGKNQKKHI